MTCMFTLILTNKCVNQRCMTDTWSVNIRYIVIVVISESNSTTQTHLDWVPSSE